MFYVIACFPKPVVSSKSSFFLNQFGLPFCFSLRDALYYASSFNRSDDDVYYCVKPF